MLAIGKIIPESSVLGSIVADHRDEHRHALRRRARRDEHAERERRPSRRACSPRAAARRLPRNGTWNTSHAASKRGDARWRRRAARYGSTLPTMICHGRSGETSSTSSVPRSFSRDSEIAVISAETSVSTSAIEPGTKRFTLSSVGLKRMRTRGTMRTRDRAARRASACVRGDHGARVACIVVPVFGSDASLTTSSLRRRRRRAARRSPARTRPRRRPRRGGTAARAPPCSVRAGDDAKAPLPREALAQRESSHNPARDRRSRRARRARRVRRA